MHSFDKKLVHLVFIINLQKTPSLVKGELDWRFHNVFLEEFIYFLNIWKVLYYFGFILHLRLFQQIIYLQVPFFVLSFYD